MAAVFLPTVMSAAPKGALSMEGFLLDLDADKGVVLEEKSFVGSWANQVKDARAALFVKRDEGRAEKGSGRPTLRKTLKELKGQSALVFRQGELVNMEEDVFDGLTTGKGFTWFCVLAIHELFVNGAKAVTKASFQVTAEANPSRMAVGQERDAIQHPGKESFDGEIARLLIYERPLSDKELKAVIVVLQERYGL